ncbi:MAG: epoxyqueuosine reductase QueH [Deltaproteobacteria bacterium]|nr:epoxyqueuosine reductase QueH [Deltaproteobacteria bacterium]
MSHDKRDLLVHVCCAPCATAVFEALAQDFAVTAFFYNPNIQPDTEYQKRLEHVQSLCRMKDIPLVIPEYDEGSWVRQTAGLEHETEGGSRCSICFRVRLARTVAVAQTMGIGTVATTLSVSPHKNVYRINEAGADAVQGTGIVFLDRDFKKRDGYRKSCELSRKYGLYRQKYCGCLYSLPLKSEDGTV